MKIIKLVCINAITLNVIIINMLFCLLFHQSVHANQSNKLTIERIFSDPSLSGPYPIKLKSSPLGNRVTYLKAKETDFNQYDLWEFNIEENKNKMLVDSLVLYSGVEKLSNEEKARRERKRIASYKGIVEYYWSENGESLLFPLNGDIYVYDLKSAQKAKKSFKGINFIKRLTKTKEFETDIRFSPQGKYVSFIRDNNLYIIDIKTIKEKQLTNDGTKTIKNGVAEFIAQEEMGRYTGYWWADDEQKIAFTQIDESPIKIQQRYEINAEDFKVFKQRYPEVGTSNVKIKLGVINIRNKKINWINAGMGSDYYLNRVNWVHDSERLAIQVQQRNQKTQNLILANIKTGKTTNLIKETSSSWINLHDDLYIFKKSNKFIWASERSGFKHLYLYNLNGKLINTITSGNWMVTKLNKVDEENEKIYFTATKDSPLERHLYSTLLSDKVDKSKSNSYKITKITKNEGFNIVKVDNSAKIFINTFSNPTTPPKVSLNEINGKFITYLEENKLDKTHPYYPYFKYHSSPEFGTIKTKDNIELYFQIIKPPFFDNKKKYPVIVSVYGGPRGQKVKKKWQWYFAQYMAQNGYLVFSIDNRGTGYRGVAFDSPIYGKLGDIEVKDQVFGIDYLNSLSFVDSNNIGIFGWSYGGYLTVMCMAKENLVFKAGVSVAPVTDWKFYDTHYTERFLGHPKGNANGYKMSSVFPYLDDLKGKLLLIHGMADDNVLFSNSTKLYYELQKKVIPFDMMVYPGSKHGLSGKKIGTHVFNKIVSYFDLHLK